MPRADPHHPRHAFSRVTYARRVRMANPEKACPSAEAASQDNFRRNGGADLRWVLEDSGEFPDLPGLDQMRPEQVVSLGGGVDAATYLVRCPSRDVVVKLN